MFTRLLRPPKRSFFLFGPRATGKTTWLRQNFKDAIWFDLLQNELYFSLISKPGLFREKVLAQPRERWIVIDEVQRIPGLLNEVHSLMESHGLKFALTGSSARKLKHGQANLLAGRASVLKMFPLIRAEYRQTVTLDESLKYGLLPAVINDGESRVAILEAYTGTYLREEIKEEALTRNVDGFSRFLDVAALANAQVTNLSSLSRDASVSRATVTTYFEILEDTLIGSRLNAWTPRARVKEVSHPKFYFFDCGVVRAIQGRLRDPLSPEERGHLLETWIYHELMAALSYLDPGGKLFFWRTADGVEVDFIWEQAKRRVAIEVKGSKNWKSDFDKGFIALKASKVRPDACYGVYLGPDRLKKEWGVVFPVFEFLDALAAGEILK